MLSAARLLRTIGPNALYDPGDDPLDLCENRSSRWLRPAPPGIAPGLAIPENLLPVAVTGHHVIHRARVLDANWPAHSPGRLPRAATRRASPVCHCLFTVEPFMVTQGRAQPVPLLRNHHWMHPSRARCPVSPKTGLSGQPFGATLPASFHRRA